MRRIWRLNLVVLVVVAVIQVANWYMAQHHPENGFTWASFTSLFSSSSQNHSDIELERSLETSSDIDVTTAAANDDQHKLNDIGAGIAAAIERLSQESMSILSEPENETHNNKNNNTSEKSDQLTQQQEALPL